MSLANFLDANGQLRVEDASADVVTCNQVRCTQGVYASSLQMAANSASVTLSVDAGGNVTAGSGRFMLDTLNMRPAAYQLSPPLSASINPGGSGIAIASFIPALKISKTGTLYRLVGTLSTSATFATAPTLEFYLATTPTGARDPAFAIRTVTATLALSGANTLALDLWCIAAAPLTQLSLNVTSNAGVVLSSNAWSSQQAAFLQAENAVLLT